jgi:hypothetical protein
LRWLDIAAIAVPKRGEGDEEASTGMASTTINVGLAKELGDVSFGRGDGISSERAPVALENEWGLTF